MQTFTVKGREASSDQWKALGFRSQLYHFWVRKHMTTPHRLSEKSLTKTHFIVLQVGHRERSKIWIFKLSQSWQHQVGKTLWLLGLKGQGEERCMEPRESWRRGHLVGTVAFSRKLPAAHSDSMRGDKGRQYSASAFPFSGPLSLFVSYWMQPKPSDRGLIQAFHVSLPGHQGREEKMKDGLTGAKGRYLTQGETLGIWLDISESNILIFNLGKEYLSHKGVVENYLAISL